MQTDKDYPTLLKDSLSYHPLYRNGLSNHLPMVLHALHKMGAANQQLSHFYRDYISKLETLNPPRKANKLYSIKDKLGDGDSFFDYLAYFQSKIEKQGKDQTLKESVPALISGLSASAFHAIIRLAYAIESENENDLALSLAYWASEFQPFNLSAARHDKSLETIVSRLNADWVNYPFSPGIISDHMLEVSQTLNKKNLSIQPKNIDLATIAAFCINTYAMQSHFTVLHTVTGCHAFRIVSAYLGDMDKALRYLWEAIVIAYLSTGLKYETPAPISMPNCKNWTDFKDQACKSNDDHIIKLVYSCWQENAVYKHPAYKFIAAQTIKGIH